jgi:hypothetical protein
MPVRASTSIMAAATVQENDRETDRDERRARVVHQKDREQYQKNDSHHLLTQHWSQAPCR